MINHQIKKLVLRNNGINNPLFPLKKGAAYTYQQMTIGVKGYLKTT